MEVVGLLCLGGGFKCDPPLFALHNGSASRDVVIVQVNMLIWARSPQSTRGILNRIDEITVNGSFLP